MELGTHKISRCQISIHQEGHYEYEYKEIKISTRNGWPRALAQVERHKDLVAERRARAHTQQAAHQNKNDKK